MDSFDEGLRCQDVNAGLRNIDQSSAILGNLAETQRVGMSAGVAALIRGRDVIEDAQNLQAIAADQLDVNAFAFNSVIETLEEAGLIADVRRSGRKVVSFTENVPYYSDLYGRLGASWRNAGPTELEQQVVMLVDRLARSPVEQNQVVKELGLDSSEFPEILEVSERSNLIKSIDLGGDKVLYSPFLGFEKPQLIADVIRAHGSDELANAFETVRGEQGLPVSIAGPVIEDAVARGLLMAPSVELPTGKFEAFATLPYTIDQQMLRNEKPVMEKALAVIACLRTGQHFGGFSSLSRSALVAAIDKLLAVGSLNPHSSSERQYRLLNRVGVIQLAPDVVSWGTWRVPTLIDTEDNRAALILAKELLTYGESVSSRMPNQSEIGQLLDNSDPYGAPMKTVARYRDKQRMNDKKWQKAIDTLMGHASA
ncbi:hypothetical protein [Agromyces ramosus]|uniref:Uncharacterized protein n=1 Tax=Agromyces ramosus TaxID=33879 RepID=A0ABU0R6Y9_9MICO|nr:hypothetical protein [Agromyces ramosus]MDQ0893497.1 hypothetical protein [Agromyces ramosus]